MDKKMTGIEIFLHYLGMGILIVGALALLLFYYFCLVNATHNIPISIILTFGGGIAFPVIGFMIPSIFAESYMTSLPEGIQELFVFLGGIATTLSLGAWFVYNLAN